MKLAKFATCDRGTTAIEFAVVAPIMVALILGTLYAGVLVYSAMGMQVAVEQAARCYSLGATQCSTAATTQTYAQTSYSGLSSPTFVVSTPTCGHQVQATLTFNLGWTVPLTAKACFPESNAMPELRGQLLLGARFPALCSKGLSAAPRANGASR